MEKSGFNKKDISQVLPFPQDDNAESPEQAWTSEWDDAGQDLDAMMEISAVVPDVNPVEEISHNDSMKIVVDKINKKIMDSEPDEEQKSLPVADIKDADFNSGKKFNLPCSSRRLEKIMCEIGIDGIATTEASCMVKITNAACPALCGLVVSSPNFRELNFLAKRLKKMPAEELKKFNNIMVHERQLNPHITPAEAINISYNTDNYRIFDVSGAKTAEERFQKLGANKDVYQSSADIDKLSGFANSIKSSFKFS